MKLETEMGWRSSGPTSLVLEWVAGGHINVVLKWAGRGRHNLTSAVMRLRRQGQII
jgi:hypothetical protein